MRLLVYSPGQLCAPLLKRLPSNLSTLLITEGPVNVCETPAALLSSTDEQLRRSAAKSFAPDVVVDLFSNVDLSDYQNVYRFVLMIGSTAFHEIASSEAILSGQDAVSVALLHKDDNEWESLSSVSVPILTTIDTGISLKYRIAETAIGLLTPHLLTVSGSLTPHILSHVLECQDLNTAVRAFNQPPTSVAEICIPSGSYYTESLGELALIENRIAEQQCANNEPVFASPLASPVGSEKPDMEICSRGSSAVSTAPSSPGNFFFSNIGGSIIKIDQSKSHDHQFVFKPFDRQSQCAEEAEEVSLSSFPTAHMAPRPHELSGYNPRASILTKKKLRMNEPLIGLNANLYVQQVLASNWLGVEGPFTKRLERMFANSIIPTESKELLTDFSRTSAVAVNSGTAALFGALKGIGVNNKSHIVLCPGFTCAACADAVAQAGGTPVIVDVELESFAMSIESLKEAVEHHENVYAVILAPCYGCPARDLIEIATFCKANNIHLIEDNCETYGASFELDGCQFPVGSLGDVSVVSVRSEKMVGVGEGGLIISKNPEIIEAARWWCSRAPTKGVGLWRVYEHDEIGYNYRMCEMLSAVGCAGFENLPSMIDKKKQVHQWYVENMKSMSDERAVRFQRYQQGDDAVWWINAFVLPEGVEPEKVGLKLLERFPDIEIRPGFYPINKMKPFAGSARPCPNTELLYNRVICLPSSPFLTKEDVTYICDALVKVLKDSS